jgi:protein-S-isoprenylcysteine O-methyltransferase Ste14
MAVPFWGVIALAYHFAARLAYVLYIGLALRREERTRYLAERYGPEGAFRRFRRMAAILMYNDATSFVVLCLASWGTLTVGLPRVPVLIVGAVLVIVGSSIKLWAAATLGAGPYYWRTFFVLDGWKGPSTAGPYRYLRNPMYTVGYLQTYGFALVTRSWPGLAAALIDHIAILLFYQLVEKPHFERTARVAAGL